MADPHDATAHISGGAAPSHTHASHTGIGAGDHHAEDHDHDGTPTQKLLAANSHESPSADTHHAKVHGDAEHPAMGQMKVIRKTADETITTTTTMQDDNHLFFAVAANEVWTFSGVIVFSSGTTEDFKYMATGPAGSSGFITRPDSLVAPTALGAESLSVNGTTGSDIAVPITGVIENGGTAGNLQIRWAQFASVALDCTVREHSFLLAHRVA